MITFAVLIGLFSFLAIVRRLSRLRPGLLLDGIILICLVEILV
jgi:hypothetical protein